MSYYHYHPRIVDHYVDSTAHIIEQCSLYTADRHQLECVLRHKVKADNIIAMDSARRDT
jgi:hypothetical protein